MGASESLSLRMKKEYRREDCLDWKNGVHRAASEIINVPWHVMPGDRSKISIGISLEKQNNQSLQSTRIF